MKEPEFSQTKNIRKKAAQVEAALRQKNIYSQKSFEMLVDLEDSVREVAEKTKSDTLSVLRALGVKEPLQILNESMHHWDRILRVKEILTEEELKAILKEQFQLNVDESKEVFIPTDELEIKGNAEGIEEENREDVNRIGLAIETLLHTKVRGEQILLENLKLTTGKVPESGWRERPYWIIELKKYNIAFFVNNQYGNRTFAVQYKTTEELSNLAHLTKEQLKERAEAVDEVLHFIYSSPGQFKAEIATALELFTENFPTEGSTIQNTNVKEAPAGWMTNKGLGLALKASRATIKIKAEKYRAANPQWFCTYLDKRKIPREHLSPELVKIVEEQIQQRGEDAPDGWITNSRLALKVLKNVAETTTSKIAEEYRAENPKWFHNYLDKVKKLEEHYSPELVKIIEERVQKRGQEAPEGWLSIKGLAKFLKIHKTTTARIAEEYRAEHPEWFKLYLNKIKRPTEHYSPELVKALQEQLLKRAEEAPQGWMTNGGLTVLLDISNEPITKIAEEYREEHPEWFKIYLNKIKRPNEHYSPELVKIIMEALQRKKESN